mgnify:CR=1 FL=1
MDVCREGAGPLSHMVPRLQAHGALPARWRLLSAAPTYNPLGRLTTFVSAADIGAALLDLTQAPQPTQAPTPTQAPRPVGARVATAAASEAAASEAAASEAAAGAMASGTATAGAATVPPLAARRHSAAAPPPPPPLRALLICPGRGSYNSSELGSLGRLARREAWAPIVEEADARCVAVGLEPVSALDARPQFARATHLEAAHASALTFTVSAADFAARTGTPGAAWAPVGIIGNSLGWYTATHLAGCLPFGAGLDIVLRTGGWQRQHSVGGQLVYPTLTDEWLRSDQLQADIDGALRDANQVGYASLSIALGGASVLAADDAGLAALKASLPPLSRGRFAACLRALPPRSAARSAASLIFASIIVIALSTCAGVPPSLTILSPVWLGVRLGLGLGLG